MKSCRGYSLLECLAYIAVLTVVLTLAYPAFYRVLLNSRQLHENADDIVRVLHVGEKWRTDIRAATGPVRCTADTIIIPQRQGDVTYTADNGTVWRVTGESRAAVLRRVKVSQMKQENRTPVTACRWEVELATAQPAARVRPLFSFLAVAGGGS